MIDFENVSRELERRGMTLSLLWNECCDSAVARGEEPYMRCAFCGEYKAWARIHDVRIVLARSGAFLDGLERLIVEIRCRCRYARSPQDIGDTLDPPGGDAS